MPGLGTYIESFLAADGFRPASQEPGYLVAERPRTGGGLDRRIIWYADPDSGLAPDEAQLLAGFQARGARTLADSPTEGTQAFFVTPTLAGLSTAFRQKANALGVGIRVPVQFFDTPYKIDGDEAFGAGRGAEARSVFADFLRDSRAMITARVPQPFVALSSLGAERGGFGSGPDLLPTLVAALITPPDAPGITIIIGNAGAGKSCLFAALFDALNRHFAAEKRAQRLASRPILFLPAHIRDAQVKSVDGLLAAVAATDAAAATSPALMRWLNSNGLTTWMFDGLDEFFAGEADFAEALEASIAPESRARTVICVRDSLLTTSTALRALIDRHIDGGGIRIFELARWDRRAQRGLAWLGHEKRLPTASETADPPEVAAFLATLDQHPALAELATLPYYCDLLLSLGAGQRAAARDEFDLIAAVVDGLIDREAAKLEAGEQGFEWDVFSGADAFVEATDMVAMFGTGTFNVPEERARLLEALKTIGRDRLVELIEGLAHCMRMFEPYPNEGQGLSVDELRQMAAFYLDVGLVPGLEPRVLLALIQLAFFGPGAGKGHVRFAHEIIADFLAARHGLALIRAHPESADALGQALGVRRDLDRSIFFRYLVHELKPDADLCETIAAHVAAGRVRAAYAANAGLLTQALARSS